MVDKLQCRQMQAKEYKEKNSGHGDSMVLSTELAVIIRTNPYSHLCSALKSLPGNIR